MAEQWRPLDDRERALIEKLLTSESFPGSKELLRQLDGIVARQVFEDGTLDLRVSDTAPRAQVQARVPVEAEMTDADGTGILILLHVVDGRLNELEVVKGDDTPIVQQPTGSQISIRARDG
jgi:hypothetical protein